MKTTFDYITRHIFFGGVVISKLISYPPTNLNSIRLCIIQTHIVVNKNVWDFDFYYTYDNYGTLLGIYIL